MKGVYAVLVYSAVALALMAPMASEDRFLYNGDHSNHVAVIHQAAAALGDGQFPIRSAPLAHGGVLYPLFQFYSPLPYTLAGLIYRHWFTASAYLSYKLTLILYLVAAGFAIRMAILRLTGSRNASFIAGLSYLTMPYLMVNLHARGAFTEVLGQCGAALVAWAVVELEQKRTARNIAVAAVAWAALATTHLITFAYVAILFSIAALLLAAWRRSPANLISFAVSLAGGGLLAAWYLIPAATADYLTIRRLLPNPYAYRGYSPIEAVLLPYPTIPEAVRSGVRGFYSSAGIATLLGVAICFGLSRRFLRRGPGELPHMIIFAALAVASLFAVVSPFDFWTSLPAAAAICQFPYRLLACAGLCGALCAGMAYAAVVRSETKRLVPSITAAVLLLSVVPFRSTVLSDGRTPKQVAANPDTGYGARDYLVAGEKVQFDVLPGGLPVPLRYGDHWLILNSPAKLSIPPSLRGSPAKLEIAGGLLPGLASASLSLIIDGNLVGTRLLKPDFGATEFPFRVPSAGLITIELRSSEAKSPHDLDSNAVDLRKLAVLADRLTLRAESGALKIEAPANCRLVALVFECPVEAAVEGWLTLPIFYYPEFLRIDVDGRGPVPYSAVRGEIGSQVIVQLSPGRHHVRAQFVGSPLGNKISAFAALTLLALFAVPGIQKYRSAAAGAAKAVKPTRTR